MAGGFFNSFVRRRLRVAHPDAPGRYTYHAGDLPTPGAMTFAFQSRYANPVQAIDGTGIIVREMRVIEGPPVIQGLTLVSNPYQGTPVGSMALQGLILPSDNGDSSDA